MVLVDNCAGHVRSLLPLPSATAWWGGAEASAPRHALQHLTALCHGVTCLVQSRRAARAAPTCLRDLTAATVSSCRIPTHSCLCPAPGSAAPQHLHVHPAGCGTLWSAEPPLPWYLVRVFREAHRLCLLVQVSGIQEEGEKTAIYYNKLSFP